MTIGPVEYIVVGFPGNQFNGKIAPELIALVESGTVRVLDLIFIGKDADGSVLSFEIDEFRTENFQPLNCVAYDFFLVVARNNNR